MTGDFNTILDECVERILRGASLEECLASYPEYVEELEAALRAQLEVLSAYFLVPSPAAKEAARRRFLATLESRRRRTGFRPLLSAGLFGGPNVWAAAVAVLVVAVIGYSSFRLMFAPGAPIPDVPVAQANFVFLISDEVNAIDDFRSLDITITGIGLHQGGELGQWLEIAPQVPKVDLTRLQGENAQEIWSGTVPEGVYTKVFIHVERVAGVLKADPDVEREMKLPSSKLRMNSSFEVTADSVVSFVYDVTVNRTGNEKAGIKYILKPQIGQSGAGQKFKEVPGNHERP